MSVLIGLALGIAFAPLAFLIAQAYLALFWSNRVSPPSEAFELLLIAPGGAFAVLIPACLRVAPKRWMGIATFFVAAFVSSFVIVALVSSLRSSLD